MKANRKFIEGEEAVSPVIAVILMVAITVVLAATVYIWVTSFSSDTSAPTTAAVNPTAINRDPANNTLTDTIQLTLSNAPASGYASSQIFISVNGVSKILADGTSNGTCEVQPAGNKHANNLTCTNWFASDVTADTWTNGESLYVDCADSGENNVVVRVGDSVVLQRAIRCDE